MEPPEESFPAGLTYNKFKSAYAQTRRGASSQEVSNAWNRYKEITPGKKSPVVSVGRKSPVRSPVKVTLATLPGDIRRLIATTQPRVAPTLQRVSRALRETSRVGILQLCDEEVSIREISLLLDRYRREIEIIGEKKAITFHVGAYQTLEYNQMVLMDQWFKDIIVSMQYKQTRLIYEDRNTTISMDLGWEFTKQVILDIVSNLASSWSGIQSNQYILAIDQKSLYNILTHRRQCVEANEMYAENMTIRMVLRTWQLVRETLPLRNNLNVGHLLAHMSSWLARVGPGDTFATEAEIVTIAGKIVYDKYNPLYEVPRVLRPCDDVITTYTLKEYLKYTDSKENGVGEMNWFGRRYDLIWIETMAIRRIKTPTPWEQISSHYLSFKRSKQLDAGVSEYTYILPSNRNSMEHVQNLRVDQVARNFLDGDNVLCLRDLRLVLALNEGCIQRDRFYIERRSRQLLLTMFEKVLTSRGLVLDQVRNMNYFQQFAPKSKLTASVFNQLATVWFFLKHTIAVGESTSHLEIAEPKATNVYHRYSAMIVWCRPRLAKLLETYPPPRP